MNNKKFVFLVFLLNYCVALNSMYDLHNQKNSNGSIKIEQKFCENEKASCFGYLEVLFPEIHEIFYRNDFDFESGFNKKKSLENSSKKHFVGHLIKNLHKCPFCGDAFIKVRCLRFHISKVHNECGLYSCKRCDYKAPSVNSFMKHYRIIHEKSKFFECDQCDYVSFKKVQLSNHQECVHEQKKNYKCKYCNYASYFSGNVKRHMATRHREKFIKH